MRELPSDKLNIVTEAFVVVPLMANAIWEAVVGDDEVPAELSKQIEEDAAIIMDRMKVVLDILDEHYAGFRELVQNADRKAQKRAAELIAQERRKN